MEVDSAEKALPASQTPVSSSAASSSATKKAPAVPKKKGAGGRGNKKGKAKAPEVSGIRSCRDGHMRALWALLWPLRMRCYALLLQAVACRTVRVGRVD